MKIKKKICKIEDCSNYCYSSSLCKYHYFKEKPPKSISKISKKGLEKKEKKKEYTQKQWELFEKHWNSKPHYCESCGKWLGNENNLCFHDHLIEKSKRKDLALEIDNLFLCCFDCHNLKTNGFPTDKHQEAINKIKEKYGK